VATADTNSQETIYWRDAHSGYHIENVTIRRALRFGLVLNGSADNVLRATMSHGYLPLHDPVRPGINRPIFRNLQLTGPGTSGSQGIYAVSVSAAELTDITVRQFSVGVHAEDWVAGMQFQEATITENTTNLLIEGTKQPATGVSFERLKRQ